MIQRVQEIPFNVPKLSEEMLKALEDFPSESEVKEMVFSMSQDSAARPNGFSALFYQECWEIIKKDLMEAIFDFFLGYHQLKVFTSTLSVLIPKRMGVV